MEQRGSPRRLARTTPPLSARPPGARGLVSVLVSFTPVRRRSPAATAVVFGQVTNGGGHW
jgi:hypothetical protein